MYDFLLCLLFVFSRRGTLSLLLQDVWSMALIYEGEERAVVEGLGHHLTTLGPLLTINTVIEFIQNCPDSILRPYAQNFVTER